MGSLIYKLLDLPGPPPGRSPGGERLHEKQGTFCLCILVESNYSGVPLIQFAAGQAGFSAPRSE
jgi:hypothetical protein